MRRSRHRLTASQSCTLSATSIGVDIRKPIPP